MRKLEKHFLTIAILLFLASVHLFATKQIRLRDDIWQLIGYSGDFNTAGSGGYSLDQSREVQDIVDDNTTWLQVSAEFGLGYNAQAGYELDYTTTTAINSPLGIFVFDSVRFANGGATTQTTDIVNMKVLNARPRFIETPMYTSYYSGENGDVVLRVSYQADYSGEIFRLRYDNRNYYAYFNPYSYDEPGVLIADIPSNTDTLSLYAIEDVFDFNITDNNLSAMRLGFFSGDDITKYSTSSAYDLIVYHLSDAGIWELFNSRNEQLSTFDALQKGRGYWVRTTNANAATDPMGTHTGIIQSSSAYLPSEYYQDLPHGWNLVSFGDSELVHVPTAVFAPIRVFTTEGGLNIFFSTHNDLSDPATQFYDGNISVVSDGTNIVHSADVAQYINIAAEYNAKIFGTNINMRAFPAMNVQGEVGVMIAADSLFELNISNSTSVFSMAGQDLALSEFNLSRSIYGERLIGIDFREDLNTTELNASITVTFGEGGDGITLTDLNETNKLNVVSRISDAFSQLSTEAGTEAGLVSSIYLVAIDFDETLNYEENSSFTQILVAANGHFSVRDSVFAKAFEKVGDGVFQVIGNLRTQIEDLTTNLTDTMEELVDFINNFAGSLGVIAKSVGAGSNEVLMLIGSSNNIDIVENDDYTIFNDISLNSNLILTAEKNQGSIRGYFTYSDMLALPVNMDINLTDSNLTYEKMRGVEVNGSIAFGTFDASNFNLNQARDFKINPIIAPYFPGGQGMLSTLSGAKKDLLSILNQEHSADGRPYWTHTDTTKIPSSWLDPQDKQALFSIRSHNGYFVKLKEFIPLSPDFKSLESHSIRRSNIYHFNNTLTDGVGVTTNHINHVIDFTFKSAFINPAENPYFGVFATFLEREYSLTSTTPTFSFRVNDIVLGISQGDVGSDPFRLVIQAYDGTGNFYAEDEKPVIEIDFVKPETPDLDYTANGDLIYSGSAKNIELEAYRGALSDVAAERAKVLIPSDKVSTAVTWKHPYSSDYDGLVFPIRFLAINTTSRMYSDLRTTLYAPLKTTQVLIATEDHDTDYAPYDLIINTQLENNYGVGLGLYEPAKNKEVRMAYYPELKHLESDKNPTRLAAPVYLRISSNSSTNGSPIATISYLEEYVGKRFYIFFQNKLYQGTFPELGSFSSDATAYDLGARVLSVDDIVNNTETAAGLISEQSTRLAGVEVDPKTLHHQNIGYLPDEKSSGPLPELFLFSKPIPTLDENGDPYEPAFLLPE